MSYTPNRPPGQATMANSGPVVLASDQTTIPTSQADVTAAISIAANSTSSGACTSTGGAGTYVVQLSGTWSATVQVQLTYDGTNWVNLASTSGVWNASTLAGVNSASITANGLYIIPATGAVGARVITTTYTSGTVVGTARLVSGPAPVPVPLLAASTLASIPKPTTAGGNAIYSGSITTTVTQVKSGAGQVYGWAIHNPNAAIVYVQFFALATGSVTLGTTAPTMSIGIPANGTAQMQSTIGIALATAINVACTTTRAGSTAPASSVDLNIFFT